LQKAAAKGPVVVLNASGSEYAALALTLSGVEHIPFPRLNPEVMELMATLLEDSLRGDLPNSFADMHVLQNAGNFSGSSFHSDTNFQPPRTSPQLDDVFRIVLATLWISVVEPVVRALDLKASLYP
jgi:hypothetical protein